MTEDPGERTTHFGYQEVPESEKAQRVAGVFSSVAGRYDLMNDLMSLGLHRLWKRAALDTVGARPGQAILDLATGTGDLAESLARQVGSRGRVVASDINRPMLEAGRDRLTDAGCVGNVAYVQADAERLPFADERFHAVTIAFGLRNVTRQPRALREMHRILRAGGRAVILEFSRPHAFLGPAYDAYSFTVLPGLGRFVAGDAESYRYLAESIRMHPDQATLRDMMSDAGFTRCDYRNLSCGIVSIHWGYKV